MKTIKVNKLCKINQDNIAPSRDRRQVAVNVTQYIEDEKGFINYCLAINKHLLYSEVFMANLIKMDVSIDFDKVYVEKIEHNVTDKETLNFITNCLGYLIDDDEMNLFVSKIYGYHDEVLAIAYVFNYHNGYYSHEVYSDINNNTKVDYI